MVQLLSSDCVSSFVKLVDSLYDEKEEESQSTLNDHIDISFNHAIRYQISVLERESHILEPETLIFLKCFEDWLAELPRDHNFRNLDDHIKTLCLHIVETTSSSFNPLTEEIRGKREQFRREFLLSKWKIYSTIYMSLYLVFKAQNGLNERLNLTMFKFERGNSRHCQYFIFRIMSHKEEDENTSFDKLFSEWLHCLYEKLLQFSQEKQSLLESLILDEATFNEIKLVLQQLDCYSRVNQARSKKSKHEFVKSILKSSWIYLVDVLTGCLINTDLSDVEKILFYDRETSNSEKPDLLVDNSDFSFVVFILRSTLESLSRLLKLVAGISSMENELNQLFFILVDGNFFQNGTLSSCVNEELSLNKIICLDFVFYSSLSMICDVSTLLGKQFQ